MENKVEIIAEIAQAHEGSLGIAHSYIDALAGTGIDTVKFQMHIASAESSEYEQFRVNFSKEDKTRYDYWHRMGFTFDQWAGLKDHCTEKGLRFLCSPFSVLAFEWLERLGADRYKIASGETTNLLMLEKICATKKPVLISSGMSGYSEIRNSVDFISSRNGNLEGIFQCTTAYPTPPEKYGLNVITDLRQQYPCKIGLSDHSGEIYAALAATALGAEMLEMHVVFDKAMFGPDAKSSLTINEFSTLVDGVRKISRSLLNPVDKNATEGFNELKTMFGKSLAINKDLPAGHVIGIDDLETKKPGNKGIPASEYNNVLGKKLQNHKQGNSFLDYPDIE